MNLVAAYRARVAKTDKVEFHAACLRVVVLIAIALYISAYLTTTDRADIDSGKAALIAIAIWTLAGLGLSVAHLIRPTISPTRRVIGMALDLGMLTYFLFAIGSSGAIIVYLYLWIIFGNGFRYGRRYLVAAQAISVVALVLVILFSPWWSQNKIYGVGWLMAVLLLPMYVGKLAERMRAALVQKDEALKECLARVGVTD